MNLVWIRDDRQQENKYQEKRKTLIETRVTISSKVGRIEAGMTGTGVMGSMRGIIITGRIIIIRRAIGIIE